MIKFQSSQLGSPLLYLGTKACKWCSRQITCKYERWFESISSHTIRSPDFAIRDRRMNTGGDRAISRFFDLLIQ